MKEEMNKLLIRGISCCNYNMKRSKLYTRTGDKGHSSLFNGERRPKDDQTFEALGTIDELNCVIGVALCYTVNKNLVQKLESVQSRLFELGSLIAKPSNDNVFENSRVTELEQWIDETDAGLPPLKNFILPSGGLCASHLHTSRAVCRRAERTLVPLLREFAIDHNVFIYMNRLSDFLFVCARFAAKEDGKEEKIWRKC